MLLKRYSFYLVNSDLKRGFSLSILDVVINLIMLWKSCSSQMRVFVVYLQTPSISWTLMYAAKTNPANKMLHTVFCKQLNINVSGYFCCLKADFWGELKFTVSLSARPITSPKITRVCKTFRNHNDVRNVRPCRLEMCNDQTPVWKVTTFQKTRKE